jgi:hypothetical protein
MPQTIACPNCTQSLSVPDGAAGKMVRCPRCQRPFAIPAPAAPVVSVAPVGPRAPVAPAPASHGTARRCPTCQAQLPPGARACLDCGTLLPAGPAPAPSNGPARPYPVVGGPIQSVPQPAPRPAPPPPAAIQAMPPAPAPPPMLSPAPDGFAAEKDSGTQPAWLRLLPAALLGLTLVALLGRDFFQRPGPDQGGDDEPVLAEPEIDKDPRVALVYLPNFMQFGLTMLKEKDGAGNPKKLTFIAKIQRDGKEVPRLTSFAAIRIDGRAYTPGEWFLVHGTATKGTGVQQTDNVEVPFPGKLVEREANLPRDDTGQHEGKRSAWLWDRQRIRLEQTVEIIAGQPDPASDKRLLDTCLVRFTLTNEDSKPHKVGLRFILDTFIGANDGVPFYIPRKDNPLCKDQEDFARAADVPDYIQALEFPQLDKPGTVAQVTLKSGGLEPPSRVSLTHYLRSKPEAWFKVTDKSLQAMRDAGVSEELLSKLDSLKDRELVDREFVNELVKCISDARAGKAEVDKLVEGLYKFAVEEVQVAYPIPLADIRGNPFAQEEDGKKPDSAVVLYWEDKELGPGQSREVGFAYGLGHISSGEGGKLALTPPTNPREGEDFPLVAYVSDPVEGQSVELILPKKGLKLVEGTAKQTVPPLGAEAASRNSSVVWRVKADKAGTYKVMVRSSTGEIKTLTVVVAARPRIL